MVTTPPVSIDEKPHRCNKTHHEVDVRGFKSEIMRSVITCLDIHSEIEVVAVCEAAFIGANTDKEVHTLSSTCCVWEQLRNLPKMLILQFHCLEKYAAGRICKRRK